MTDYKATTQQWAEVEEWVEGSECSWDHCLVELRDRVDTLEHALQQTRVDYLRLSNAVANSCSDRNKFSADLIPDENSSDSNGSDHIAEANKMVSDSVNCPKSPDSSLVDRVAQIIAVTPLPATLWRVDARTAILEVAAWLRDRGAAGAAAWAMRLEQEAGK
jgi:hypothetical protein